MEVKPGYKQTEVGVIPEEWDLTLLVELIDASRSIRYGIVQPGKFDPSGRYMIRGQDYSTGWVDPSELFRVTPQVEEPFKNARVKAGDVIITIVGASTGHIEVIPDWLDGANLTQTTARLAINPSKAFSGFCKCYLQSSAGQRQVASYLKGAAQPGLNCGDIEKFKIPLPPSLPEQRAIAEALSDADGLLGGLDRLIAKKRDLKQAAMQQLLTGQTRLPGFHGEWEVKRLGEVASFLKGKGLPKSALIPDGAEPCIHYGELFTRYPETVGEIFSRTNGSRDSFRSVANDVLMPTSDVTPRGLAKASCIPFDGVILGGDILVIRSDAKRVFGTFLSYIIRREEDQVLRLVTGSTVYHLYGSDMKRFTFLLPSLPEQTAIAEVLSEMDGELGKLEERREKTRALKQAMMQELLTGRTRLI